MGAGRREGPARDVVHEPGSGHPTQLQCCYQVLRKVQKLEVRQVTEVLHLLDSVSCQRQEAVGEGRGPEKEPNCRTAAGEEEGLRCSGPRLGSRTASGGTWPFGVREAELGLLAPQPTGSQAWRDLNPFFVLRGCYQVPSLHPPPSLFPTPTPT